MKDKNQELDFNFDNAPVRRNVDRTARTAQPSAVHNTSHSAPSSPLTASEVMSMGKQPAADTAGLRMSKAVSAPPAHQEQTQTTKPTGGDYSGAAMHIMQMMKKAEDAREPQKVTAAAISAQPEPEKAQPVASISFGSSPSEMGQFLNDRTSAAQATTKLCFNGATDTKAEPVAKAEEDDELPVMPVKIVTDTASVASSRQEKVDAFTLDIAAVEAGFDKLDIPDEQATVVMPIVTNAPNDQPVDGSTRMFDAAIENQPIKIPDYFDNNINDEDDDPQTTIDEYNSIADAQSVTEALTHRKRRLTVRSCATALFAALLVVIAFSESLFPFGHTAYFVAVGVLLGLTALVNLSTLQSLLSVFTLKPDIDFAPSFALFTAIIQTVAAAFFGVDGIAASAMLAAVAAASMTVNTISKRITVKRTLANFELIANEEPKQAGAFIEPPVSASIANPDKLGESLIFGRRTTIDLKSFIAHSLSADLYEKQSGRLSLVIVIAAVIACAAAAFKQGSLTAAITALTAVGCAGAQIAAVYPSAVLLARVCRRLRSNRVMLSGFKAAQEISDANVVVLDSDELFMDDDVSLFKFRTFENISPDDAFMTAAALTMEGHSPLAGMFSQIASTNGVGMLAADSVIYEDGMGLTGWVNERKTLLGNRMIMESHSIPVPPIDVDRKVLQGGHFPLYLAIDDKLAAMFIIGYAADKEMLHRVRRLVNTGVTVLVRTVDPNVTSDLICANYGLPTGSVEVMSADASRIYCDRMAPTENEPALLSAPNAKGFTDAYISAFNLHRSANAAAVTAVVLTCLVVALCVILPIFDLAALINVTTLLASYAVVGLITAMAGVINS